MRRTSISFLILTAVTLAVATSCSENIESYDNGEKGNITFRADAEALTRGTQITSASLTSFGVTATAYPASSTYEGKELGNYFYNILCEKNVATAYPWPTSDHKIAFYAYAPYGASGLTVSAQGSLGLPSYTYTVPSAIASQSDFMTAQITDRPCTDNSSVSLSFNHRLTNIQFTARNQQSAVLTVKTVSVFGVEYSGSYTSGSSWSLSGSKNSSSTNPFTLTVNKSIASGETESLTETTNQLFLLPQTVPSGTNVFIIKTEEDGEERTYTHTLTSPLTLSMAKAYTFNLVLGNGELTVNPVSVVDWQPITTVTNGFSVTDWQAQ